MSVSLRDALGRKASLRMRFGRWRSTGCPSSVSGKPVPPSHRVSECNRDDASEYILIVQTQSSLVACEGVTVVSGTEQVTVSAVGRDCQPYSGIHETVETINQLKTNREFFLSFAKDPQQFISKWLVSQMRDLKTMTDVVGSPEEERRADFYYQRWAQEAVCRYFYGKVQQRRAELEQALGIRNA
ncbi:hypothetical protein HPB49_003643 [Dermacentor silvarum]|uniref:Uncharacterized protein n=1 Tax=Dermacentor silvarum TaxID=543639 RepID=A0ACB8DAJ7_DERSI|nr:hypothetical protein HPB49_003643 [Dermacentor silvarum]